MKTRNLLFLAFFSVLLSCNTDSKENLAVFIKYKAQPDKNTEAVVALKSLLKEVEKEEHFEKIKMYIDPNDPSNILLYEEWNDENYYKNEHMKTKHLQQFISESAAFLAGPPEISFWKLNSVFK